MPLLRNLIIFALGPYIAVSNAVHGCPANVKFRIEAEALGTYLALDKPCPHRVCGSYFNANSTTAFEYTIVNGTNLMVARAPIGSVHEVGYFAYGTVYADGVLLNFGAYNASNVNCTLEKIPKEDGCHLNCFTTPPDIPSNGSLFDQAADNQWFLRYGPSYFKPGTL